ncbi:MAG: FAD-binding oxidoreductase [Deltaproteobacteria bacterium]|nr:MAG: FAD-binding oxidoreductase [Deltaproteobacteria bacterium]
MGAKEINDRLRAVLSEDGLSTDPDILTLYRVANPIVRDRVGPSRVARPRDVTELQNLVRLANEQGLHLVPVSSQGPHGKGGTACAEEHIALDLSSWKKILRTDRRNRVCMIEPGVTYGELLDALEPLGMTVPMPLAPRSGKSVAAAVMDREPSTWPNRQWDISDPVGSTEFIFGTGDIFRTGAAGGPGSLEKQRVAGGAQKSPMGPSQTDFQRVVQGSQGSLGIVTWLTVRTELRPSVEGPCLIGSDELEKLIPFIYGVQRPWLGEHSFILDRNAATLLMTHNAPDSFEAVTASLPAFICLQNIAGFERLPRERVAYQLKDIEEIAARNGLALSSSLGSVLAPELLKAATRPCGPRDFRHALRGHCLSIFFLSTLDQSPRFLGAIGEVAGRHQIERNRIGIYLQPVVQNHACHIEFMVPFDPENRGEVELMRRFEADAVHELFDEGAFFSRPYGAAGKLAFVRNQLNNAVLKKIKDIFDPNRVLNPGKFGL